MSLISKVINLLMIHPKLTTLIVMSVITVTIGLITNTFDHSHVVALKFGGGKHTGGVD